jgi:hypothetical protein
VQVAAAQSKPPAYYVLTEDAAGEMADFDVLAKLLFCFSHGAPGEIRTPGLLIRSQTLYPTELRAHSRMEAASRGIRRKSEVSL